MLTSTAHLGYRWPCGWCLLTFSGLLALTTVGATGLKEAVGVTNETMHTVIFLYGKLHKKEAWKYNWRGDTRVGIIKQLWFSKNHFPQKRHVYLLHISIICLQCCRLTKNVSVRTATRRTDFLLAYHVWYHTISEVQAVLLAKLIYFMGL